MQHREQGQPEVHLGFSNKGIKHLKPQTRFCFRPCFLQNRSLCARLSFALPKRLWKRITKLAPAASLCWNHLSWHLAGSHPRMHTSGGGRGGILGQDLGKEEHDGGAHCSPCAPAAGSPGFGLMAVR